MDEKNIKAGKIMTYVIIGGRGFLGIAYILLCLLGMNIAGFIAMSIILICTLGLTTGIKATRYLVAGVCLIWAVWGLLGFLSVGLGDIFSAFINILEISFSLFSAITLITNKDVALYLDKRNEEYNKRFGSVNEEGNGDEQNNEK